MTNLEVATLVSFEHGADGRLSSMHVHVWGCGHTVVEAPQIVCPSADGWGLQADCASGTALPLATRSGCFCTEIDYGETVVR